MWRRFATFALQKAKYLCPYKSRKVLSQALQFQTLTAQSPVGYVKHRLERGTIIVHPISVIDRKDLQEALDRIDVLEDD